MSPCYKTDVWTLITEAHAHPCHQVSSFYSSRIELLFRGDCSFVEPLNDVIFIILTTTSSIILWH